MEGVKENIAVMNAMLKTASEVAAMNKEEFRNEKVYQATMTVAKSLLEKGLISREQYGLIDTKMTEKYQPIFGGLFSGKGLI